jgi:hypothetical protein
MALLQNQLFIMTVCERHLGVSPGLPLGVISDSFTLWKMLQSQEYKEQTDEGGKLEDNIHNDRNGICFTLEFCKLHSPMNPSGVHQES